MNKSKLNFGIILGIIILLVGALILAKYYDYIPKDFLVKDIYINFLGGIGCILGGVYLLFKGISKARKGF